MKKLHNISEIKFKDDNLIINVDNQVLQFKIVELSEKLAKANEQERNDYSVSPSGYGIHWLNLDEDISIDGLLKINKLSQAA